MRQNQHRTTSLRSSTYPISLTMSLMLWGLFFVIVYPVAEVCGYNFPIITRHNEFIADNNHSQTFITPYVTDNSVLTIHDQIYTVQTKYLDTSHELVGKIGYVWLSGGNPIVADGFNRASQTAAQSLADAIKTQRAKEKRSGSIKTSMHLSVSEHTLSQVLTVSLVGARTTPQQIFVHTAVVNTITGMLVQLSDIFPDYSRISAPLSGSVMQAYENKYHTPLTRKYGELHAKNYQTWVFVKNGIRFYLQNSSIGSVPENVEINWRELHSIISPYYVHG